MERVWTRVVLAVGAVVLLCASATVCASCGGAAAQGQMTQIKERGKLIAGVKYDVPLFGELKPGQTAPQGFEIDLVKELARRMLGDPDKVEWVRVDSQSRIPKLQAGDVDLVAATMTITDERKQQIDFSDPYFEAGQSLLVEKGSPIRSVVDLAGKKVSTARGSTSAQNIRTVAPQAKVLEYADLAHAFHALQLGRVDAMTTDNAILFGFQKEHSGYEMVGGLFSQEPYGIGVQKGQTAWVDYINRFLTAIKADGTYDKLYKKWFPEPPPIS